MPTTLALNRLQRKVLLTVVIIILVPMLIAGTLSAAWVAARAEASIEHWIREATEMERDALGDLHRNARLLGHVLEELTLGGTDPVPGRSPIPAALAPLAQAFGVTLVQVYGYDGKLLYTSGPGDLTAAWAPGQDTAVTRVKQNEHEYLAALTILRLPRQTSHYYRLVLGTFFDQDLLDRLGRISGLKTRIFYPRQGDFARAFTTEKRYPLKLRLPPSAFAQLLDRHDYYNPRAEDGHYFGLYSPLVDDTGRVEAVLFSGLERYGETRLFLTDQAVITLVIALFGTLLALVTGLVIGHLVVRPIRDLHEGVRCLAAQNFRTHLPIRSQDEIGELSAAFNAMAEGLREARDAQYRALQRDKLAALGELSLAMAHEIRNPIGTIVTASRLLEGKLASERRAGLRQIIREESLHLDRLLRDFQQLARHRTPEPAPIDPAAPIEKALQMVLAGCEEISIERRYHHGNLLGYADCTLLRQAWTNLVRNAIEAMGGAGDGTLKVGSFVEGAMIVVYLQDSGPGISMDRMPRIFDPFFTTKEQGSGLGLTIANTLAEATGARLELIPGDWHGARFAIRIPMSDVATTT